MTHAAHVAELERAVVEAAVALNEGIGILEPMWQDGDVVKADGAILLNALNAAVDALLAARAETCPECEGYGVKARIIQRAPDWEEQRAIAPCPAGCDAGRRRTT